LEDTVLINHKTRDAHERVTVEPNQSVEITVTWSGPYRREEVIAQFIDEGAPPNYDGEDYGLYQIYGRHILSGADTLLYVGKATEQTFSRRFRQHNEWLTREEEISIYLGRLYDPQRHSIGDRWMSWVSDVTLVECLLIYKYSPNYNSVSVSDPPSLQKYSSVSIVHAGNQHKLASRDSAPADW